jgi:tetratricopeptide (TPR) repeat protein
MLIDPKTWFIYSISYSPPPAVEFCLNFLERDWFGAGLKGEESLTLARLLLTVYGAQCQGLLISKKDAMRAIGAEHVSTTKRYADIALQLGILKLEKSAIDRRVELLVPTDVGIRMIEKELDTIAETIRWAAAEFANDWSKASELKGSISSHPLRLEELTLVADPFTPRPERHGQPRKTEEQDNVTKQMIMQLEQAQEARPRSHARWIAAYSETIRLMPSNVLALDARSEAYKFLGDYEKALADVNRMEELQPGKWLVRRAYILNALRRYDAAIADMSRAIELEPEMREPRINRAEAYVETEEWQLALKDLDYVMEPEGTREYPPDWVRLRGYARVGVGQIKEAIDDLEYVLCRQKEYLDLVTDPDYHNTFSTGEDYRRADEEQVRANICHLEALIGDLKKRLAGASNKAKTSQRSDRAKSKGARGERARPAEPTPAPSPASPGKIVNIADYMAARVFDRLTERIRTNPKDPDAYCERAYVLEKALLYESAIDDLTHAIELDPKYLSAHVRRGWCLYQTQQHSQAISDLTEAIKIGPAHLVVDAHIMRAYASMALERWQDAFDDFSNAIAHDPNIVPAYVDRARVLEALGNKQAALTDYRKAIELQPANAEAQQNLERLRSESSKSSAA